jgi:hypothetical protein
MQHAQAKKRNTNKALVGKSERKVLFGRSKRRSECTIKMDLKETRREGLKVINLAYYRTSDGLLCAR